MFSCFVPMTNWIIWLPIIQYLEDWWLGHVWSLKLRKSISASLGYNKWSTTNYPLFSRIFVIFCYKYKDSRFYTFSWQCWSLKQHSRPIKTFSGEIRGVTSSYTGGKKGKGLRRRGINGMAKLLASKMELHEHESALPSITHLERDKSL